jgi:acyl carrier protein
MSAFTLDDLQSAAREVIGDDEIVLSPEMEANDVPGWDSLNHTLICVEIGLRLGRRVEPADMAALPNFGAMVTHLNAAA